MRQWRKPLQVRLALRFQFTGNKKSRIQPEIEGDCDIRSGVEVDHLIPLSSNKLNKELPKLPPLKGRKVSSQSLGSNNFLNLILACKQCNSRKKHRLLEGDEIRRILGIKNSAAKRNPGINAHNVNTRTNYMTGFCPTERMVYHSVIVFSIASTRG